MTNQSTDARPAPRTARDRIEAKKAPEKPPGSHSLPFLQRMRGYIDALVFAYLLAMSIRTFVFELFMIPTGSMTPTLIGDMAGEAVLQDYNDDGIDDVIYTFRTGLRYADGLLQVFVMGEDGRPTDLLFVDGVDRGTAALLARQSPRRRDMIVVNKFAYWFSPPERGDIAVFKVPYRPDRDQVWEIDKPVYIKRVIGLPGEMITIQPADVVRYGSGDPGRTSEKFLGEELHIRPRPMLADGRPIEDPALDATFHFPRCPPTRRVPMPGDEPNVEAVSPQEVLMLGDNAASSSDGRYWGPVPLNHLRGKAVLRYFPVKAFGFVE